MNVWSQFLDARRALINEWRLEGKSCTDIAEILSMDAGQVYLISQVETGEPPEDARASILESTAAALAYHRRIEKEGGK
jgi:hypothetical protein